MGLPLPAPATSREQLGDRDLGLRSDRENGGQSGDRRELSVRLVAADHPRVDVGTAGHRRSVSQPLRNSADAGH